MLNFTSNYALSNNMDILSKRYSKHSSRTKATILFSGKKYPSGEYSNWFVDLIKSKLNLSSSEYEAWTENYIETYSEKRRKERGVLFRSSVLNFFTYQADEESYWKQDINTREADCIRLRADLLNEKYAKERTKEKRRALESQRSIKRTEQIFNVREEQIKPKFCDQIQREKENKPANIPNCLMIVGSNPEINSELIEWTGRNSKCNFIQIESTDNILTTLNQAKSRYQSTRERTLIHVKGFDQLLNPEVVEDDVIESFKDIMDKTSKNYHSTIIFSTTDPSKLDQIAIQSHRVERIDANITDMQIIVEDSKEAPDCRFDDSNCSSPKNLEAHNKRYGGRQIGRF